jgi:DNA polymerase III subunit delta
MKIAPRRVAAFLARPDPEIRALLLYGSDAGLARERADGLARSVCPDLRDPFRIAELGGAALLGDPARLADEAAQLSLVGGRRVVRVRDAGDAHARVFAGFLGKMPGDALIVVEAAELAGSSALRRAFDAAPHAAAIGCYPDAPRDRAQVIREMLLAHRVTASREAAQYLVDHLGEDRLATRSELEKLALYVGDGGRVELDDALAVVGDSAALELDDAVMAAADGVAARLDRALDRAFQQGESPVAVVRAVMRHLQRLHAMAARLGVSGLVDEVMRSARPAIFFKHQDSVRHQLGIWSEPALRSALARLTEAEIGIKTTGMPAETLCRDALLAVVRAALGGATRGRGPPVSRPTL